MFVLYFENYQIFLLKLFWLLHIFNKWTKYSQRFQFLVIWEQIWTFFVYNKVFFVGFQKWLKFAIVMMNFNSGTFNFNLIKTSGTMSVEKVIFFIRLIQNKIDHLPSQHKIPFPSLRFRFSIKLLLDQSKIFEIRYGK